MASAKFANNTVNHNHRVICRLNLNAEPPLKSSTVVITLPISTTNMTGLPIILLGFSLRRASRTARRMIFHSQIAFFFFAIANSSESSAYAHEQVLQDWTEAECMKKRKSDNNQKKAD